MKHLSPFLLAAVLLLAGCHSERREITQTAYHYIIATGNYDIDAAEPYASQETRETTLAFIKNVLLPMTDTDYLKANTPCTATVDSLLVEGDTAWVAYTKTTPLSINRNTLTLVKEDGRWLVYVPLNFPYTPPADTTAQETTQPGGSPRTFTKEQIEEMRRARQAASPQPETPAR